MVRRLALVTCIAIFFAWALGPIAPAAQSAAPQTAAPAGPIKLARHPDYHAGTIAFSYLGDIWTANEDGTNPTRLTVNTAREVYPRFSPDGRWIAFSSNRFGNNDVFVIPAAGGTPRQLTFFSGGDDVVGWSRDGQQVLFRSSHGDGAFPSVATLYQVPLAGGPEKPLPVDWGYYGSFSPDGKQLVFNRHPAVWTRKHYRGSYAADLWIGDLAQETYRQLLAGEDYNRYWPMWGSDNNIYFVADPLPNDQAIKPGSLEIFKSANNIYRIAANGSGQPVQVTKHTSGSLFWPSMSGDGKVIVYEESFGIWKLDVASGRTSEIKINIATDDKENEFEVATLTNEVDSFDLSPSGQRAIISARGQLLTIATNRGDITRVAPDPMASRSQSPKWSPDGKFVAFVSDKSGRDEVWIGDPDGKDLKQITNLDNEKGALLWTPDSKALLYSAADKRLYSYSVADAKTTVVTSDTVARIGSFSISPDGKWVAFSKQDRTLRSHVYIAPIGGRRGTPRFRRCAAVLGSEPGLDGRRPVSRLHFVRRLQRRRRLAGRIDDDHDTVGGAAARSGSRSARTATSTTRRRAWRRRRRAAGGRAGGGGAPPAAVTVQIDWNNLARRARQIPVPGDSISGLLASPTGGVGGVQSVVQRWRRRARWRGGNRHAGIYIVTVDTNALARVPPGTAADTGGGPRRAWAAGAAGGGGSSMVFTRDGRTLYFRTGSALFAASVGGGGGGSCRARSGGGRWRWSRWTRRGRGGGRTGTERFRAPGDLHGEHPGGQEAAARPGVQRGLAHHEEPVLRRRDARRELGRDAHEIRAAARLPRRPGRVADAHDDDDRRAQRLAHGRERRAVGCGSVNRKPRDTRDSISSSIRPATTASGTSTRPARPITTTSRSARVTTSSRWTTAI